MYRNRNVPAIIKDVSKSLIFPVGARDIWEPVGEERNCRAIELPKCADSVRRFSRGPIQYGGLEQRLAGGWKDISILLAGPMSVDHRGFAGPIVAHHAGVNALYVGKGEQRRRDRPESPEQECDKHRQADRDE